MKKWKHDLAICGAKMIMQIKKAALDGGLDNPVTEITGYGVRVIADYLDALLKDWIDLTSKYSDAERELEWLKEELDEWRGLGFDSSPSEWKEERQAELKAIAKRWADEDEAEMDAEDLKEIEERRGKREHNGC